MRCVSFRRAALRADYLCFFVFGQRQRCQKCFLASGAEKFVLRHIASAVSGEKYAESRAASISQNWCSWECIRRRSGCEARTLQVPHSEGGEASIPSVTQGSSWPITINNAGLFPRIVTLWEVAILGHDGVTLRLGALPGAGPWAAPPIPLGKAAGVQQSLRPLRHLSARPSGAAAA